MRDTLLREGKTWPGYVFGGRMRTSTLVLIIAFLGIGWLYQTYEPAVQAPMQVPASEVVPPGFIPDPNYTWAPRTDVQRHAPTTTTPTTSMTPTTTPTTPAGTTESSTPSTPAQPTASSSPTASPDGTASPSPAPSTSATPATTASERPAAQTPTPAVPAGETTPAAEPPTQ